MDEWYIEWVSKQNEGSLKEVREFKYVKAEKAERMKLGEMFLHVINHKTYHRGWVGQMFFEYGKKPPETDLCVFLTEG